jgi:hypothetical protein
LQLVGGELLQAQADGPSIERLEREQLQDEQVQRALQEIGRSAQGGLLLVTELCNAGLSR